TPRGRVVLDYFFVDWNWCTIRRTSGRGVNRIIVAIVLFATPGTATTSPLFIAFTPYLATSAALGSFRPLTSRLSSMSAPGWKPVRVGPGHNAVTLTPVPRSSSASPSLNDNTYAFVA